MVCGIFAGARPVYAQPATFAPTLANKQTIIATALDRDSAQLFAYDAAGAVVVWDLHNMTAVRSFNTVPTNIWQPVNTYFQSATRASANIDVHTNRNKFWVVDKNRLGNNRSGTFDIYGRVSGTHYYQSDTAAVTERIQLLSEDNGVIMTRSMDKPAFDGEKMVYTALVIQDSDTSITTYLERKATCLRLSADERYVAVGYEYGGVDVFDRETLELTFQSSYEDDTVVKTAVDDIIFLNDGSGIVYRYKYTNPMGILYHRFDASTPVFISCAIRPEVIAQSPSGALLAYSDYSEFHIVKPGDPTFLYQPKRLLFSGAVNSLHFLDEEVLVLAGSAQEGAAHASNLFSSAPAGLYKVDWKRDIWSANYVRRPSARSLLNGILTAVGDTALHIRNFGDGYLNSWSHIVTPKNLENRFLSYDAALSLGAADYLHQQQLRARSINADSLLREQLFLGLVQDDGSPTANWLAMGLNPRQGALLQIARQGDQLFAGATVYKHQPGYNLMRIHAQKKLIVWRKNMDQTNGMLHLLVTDYDGNIRLRDSVQLFSESFNETPFRFSADGNWFAYRRNYAEICYAATANLNQLKTVPTGLADSTYLPTIIQFDNTSQQLAFQQYNPDSLNKFVVARVQLGEAVMDTLFALDLIPFSYALSADFNRLALHFAFDVLDTTLNNNKDRLATAARFGMRNEYAPTIVNVDLRNDTHTSIPVRNGNLVMQLLVAGNHVTALQSDGLIYYYNSAKPTDVVVQELDGDAQVILADDYYFASASKVDGLNVLVENDYYPVGKQDIYFNQPHRIMQRFGNKQTEIQALYKRAYDKRIQQFEVAAHPPDPSHPPPRIAVDQVIRQRFYTNQPVLQFPVRFTAETPVASLFATVNGYSIFGKDGLDVAKGAGQQQLSLQLDSGENHIQLQALSGDGRYSNPINLYYHADYIPPKAPKKLWILTVGVSHYEDSTYNLKYAAKDAGDIASVFAYKTNYDTVITRTLLDTQATREALLDELQQAQSLARDDVFILYLAGHGVLDASAEFHYATYDMQFDDPARRGLAYGAIIDALEQLPTRNKVLLLDACHSGLVDRTVLDTSRFAYQTAEGHVIVQDARGTTVGNTRAEAQLSEQGVFLFMQEAFASFAYDNNINVLSAALGNNLALENSRLQNGLFTYALIRGIGLAKADNLNWFGQESTNEVERRYGEASTLSIAQIKTYVEREVRRLSRGAQVPSFTLSQNATAIRFSEGYVPDYLYGTSYTAADGSSTPSDAEQYRLFLDRYKEMGVK